MPKLKFLSRGVLDELRECIGDNISRYKSGDFSDLALRSGWAIELDVDIDLEPLGELDAGGTPKKEIANSKLVWKALNELSPLIASQENIWVRLTHVECLAYSRERWLAGLQDENIEGAVDLHFFADGLTKRRDDNAISRLWWNSYIANLVMPGTDLGALDMMLKSADIRSNLVERSRTMSRAPLAAGIIRAMNRDEWLTKGEANFRHFMRVLNKEGAGILFESLTADAIDEFMDLSIPLAKDLG